MTYTNNNPMHQAERALFDLRRSVPVVVTDDTGNQGSALVFPVESIAEHRLEELASLAGNPAVLTVTRHRLQAMGVALEADAASFELRPEVNCRVQQLYDAAAVSDASWKELLGDPRPATRIEHAALTLLRRALLVPSALIAAIHPDRQGRIDRAVEEGRLLRVPVSQAERCLDLGDGLLRRVSEADVPLQDAETTRFVLFREHDGLREHLAVQIGEPTDWPDAVPVRMHSSCLTGDLFASLRCDCGEQLRNAVARIRELGGGVLLYLAQEGRGIGLANKLRAYALQDEGLDTVEADQTLGFSDDERRYGVAVDMLRALGIERIRLLTNNPNKLRALADGGIEVQENDRLYGQVTRQNRRYLTAKARRSGHLLEELLNEP
jgi:GTP cyclohydrolase II